MNKKAILILGIVALTLISFSLGTAQASEVSRTGETILIPADKIGPLKRPPVPVEKDFCSLVYTDWIPPYWYTDIWEDGDKVAIYFDPTDCGLPENYPFQLTGVYFELFDYAGATFAYMRFSVEIVCPDICDGPGIEIWKSPGYDIPTIPDAITPVDIDFEDVICLDKPFFFNVEYINGVAGENPSLLYDREVIDTCYQWLWFGQPSWIEWFDYYGLPDPPKGWVLLEIHGLCGEHQTDCGEWYFKPDRPDQDHPAPSGMPDFDQYQFGPPDSQAMCGPTAVANCLWWFDAVPVTVDDPGEFIRILSDYFNTDPAVGTDVNDIQLGLDAYFEDYEFDLYEMTYWEPDFHEMEDSLKVSQDIILLLGFWWWDEITETWAREGGHYVTMAGVNSEKREAAISDPGRDWCVQHTWWPGRVLPSEHPVWGDYDPDLHNDPTYVSHDIYISLLNPEFASPGSDLWDLADYCYQAGKYSSMNVPERFRPFTREAPKHLEYWHTEVEAAVMICPIPEENDPPTIGQDDFIEGLVDDVVGYEITGTDPNGDVILDQASIVIDPGCGNYSIVRTSGHGTSTGIWQVTWVTTDCTPCDTHLVIHGLTDTLGATGYCTTRVHLSAPSESLYWKPPYDDYAPNGMPDIDQKQDGWYKGAPPETQWTFCGPCAVANCFKWFDSKYNVPPGSPGDGVDMFPLVRDYMDNLTPFIPPARDDHDPWNVDHTGTPWNPGVGLPPSTTQPFVPGPQPQPSTMPPWGELVERLAWYFDTDGIQSGYCNHNGTNILQMQQGIQDWLESEMFEDGSTLADTLCVVLTPMPTFACVESVVEKCEDVILLLGFWYDVGSSGEQEFIRGDVDGDGRSITLSDLTALIRHVENGEPLICDDAADINDDGFVDSVDCEDLAYFFIHGIFPWGDPFVPLPFWGCGIDPTPDALGCADYPDCPGPGDWLRIGGHYVTVAGVNSEEYMIAFSDPFVDNAELGFPGRVGDGSIIPHPHGDHDPAVHNDEGNVSHDIYSVVPSGVTPGGSIWIRNYALDYSAPEWTSNFFAQNVPAEFETYTAEWDGTTGVFTEVEYCIHISPWDYRGDANQTGSVEAGDVVYLISYLFRSGPAPDPYLEGDANCDVTVTAGDIVRLIGYLFRGESLPRCCDP
jgi:hypothetical protein